MARNEEKQLGRLNRLILEKQKEEYEELHPKRPRLNTLDSVEEIQKWLPSIKRDIHFYLKKTQVVCYSDSHVNEAHEMVGKLEKEFKAFLRKIRQLSPSVTEIPWTNRPYKRKTTDSEPLTNPRDLPFKPIPTPIMDSDKQITKALPIVQKELPLMNFPLEFKPLPPPQTVISSIQVSDEVQKHTSDEYFLVQTTKRLRHEFHVDLDMSCHIDNATTDVSQKSVWYSDELDTCHTLNRRHTFEQSKKNVLGLDYDSSSEEDT